MAWLEAHQSLATHRKLYGLAEALGVTRPAAAGHLLFIWFWALDNAPDGDVTAVPPAIIKDAACWPKKADALIEALTRAGWLEEAGDRLVLHDWMDYAGKLSDRRARNKERMRCAREGHVRCTCKATQQNQPPNRTEQNQPPTPTPPGAATADERVTRACRAIDDAAGTMLITPALRAQVADWIHNADRTWQYHDEPGEWFEAASAKAAGAEGFRKHPWPYLKSILDRWQRDGFDSDSRKKPDAEAQRIRDEFAEAERRASA